MAQPLSLDRGNSFASNLNVLIGVVDMYGLNGRVPNTGAQTVLTAQIHRKLSIALHQTEECYRSSLQTPIAKIDATAGNALNELFAFVNEVQSKKNREDLENLDARVSRFMNTLQQNIKTPCVTGVVPEILQLSAVETVQIVIKGHFPNADSKDFRPELTAAYLHPEMGFFSVTCNLIRKTTDALTFDISQKIFQVINYHAGNSRLEERPQNSYLYKRHTLTIHYTVPRWLAWWNGYENKVAQFPVGLIAQTPATS